MTRYYRRRRPGREENVKAAALGVGVGLVAAAGAFYLARLFLGREVLGSPAEPRARTGSPVRAGRRRDEVGRSAGP